MMRYQYFIQFLFSFSAIHQVKSSCSGLVMRQNKSVKALDQVNLSCLMNGCPPASSITWFRSEAMTEARFPLVSDHPTMLAIKEAMPADSGWYWCDTDSYQSVRYVDVKAMPPNAHDVQAVIKMTQDAEDDTLHVTSKRLEPINVNIANVENQEFERSGTADKLKIYNTYQNKWHDRQKQKQKMLDDLETVIAQYMRPINLQLEDIYKRLSTLEKKVFQ